MLAQLREGEGGHCQRCVAWRAEGQRAQGMEGRRQKALVWCLQGIQAPIQTAMRVLWYPGIHAGSHSSTERPKNSKARHKSIA